MKQHQKTSTSLSQQLRRQQQQRLQLRSKSADASSESAAAGKAEQEQATPILTSLFAAMLGVGTVSLVAGITENLTASSVPEYDSKGQRFDQSTFAGRFSRMVLACDPALLFYSAEQVENSKALLQQYEENKAKGVASDVSDRVLWEARRVVDAAAHPDTGEIIPRPFRMSGYVPFNGPICVAMVASQSTSALLFWSWVNQSQNALVNYYNRNASSPLSNETLAISYAAAVGSALLVAFGLATAIQKKYPADQAKKLLRWVAFPSAVVASSLNCYIVRSPEIDSGIPLLDSETLTDVLPGTTSRIAAKQGVYSTTASRALLQAPVYFLPPVLLSVIGPLRRYLTHVNPALTVPVTTFLLLTSFGVGLPATVAIFPQMQAINVEDVEDEFQHLRQPKTNQPYTQFYYNKGL